MIHFCSEQPGNSLSCIDDNSSVSCHCMDSDEEPKFSLPKSSKNPRQNGRKIVVFSQLVDAPSLGSPVRNSPLNKQISHGL